MYRTVYSIINYHNLTSNHNYYCTLIKVILEYNLKGINRQFKRPSNLIWTLVLVLNFAFQGRGASGRGVRQRVRGLCASLLFASWTSTPPVHECICVPSCFPVLSHALQGCGEHRLPKGRAFRSHVPARKAVRSLLAVLRHFNWTRFALVKNVADCAVCFSHLMFQYHASLPPTVRNSKFDNLFSKLVFLNYFRIDFCRSHLISSYRINIVRCCRRLFIILNLIIYFSN